MNAFKFAANTLHDGERLVNSSVKQPLGASLNTLLFGNAILHETSIIEALDQAHNNATPLSIRAGLRGRIYAATRKTPQCGDDVTGSDK